MGHRLKRHCCTGIALSRERRCPAVYGFNLLLNTRRGSFASAQVRSSAVLRCRNVARLFLRICGEYTTLDAVGAVFRPCCVNVAMHLLVPFALAVHSPYLLHKLSIHNFDSCAHPLALSARVPDIWLRIVG
jgi:hypothetical protein